METIIDLLGWSSYDAFVNELRINDSNITSSEEIAYAFDEYFLSIDPNLANFLEYTFEIGYK